MSTPTTRSWVLVVGMHRSGTSAVAGALGALGYQLPGPDDRLPWAASNPEHNESRTLTLLDEDLLHALGGSWDGPPPMAPHWPHTAAVLAGGRARAALAAAYPEPGGSVWKDPRLCLLLPYWRRLLNGPLAAVFVWRPPLAVARSLEHRDAMPIADGLALWERYNRAALAALRGLPVSVVEYDAMVADPPAFVEDTAAWLGSLERFPGASSSGARMVAAGLVQRDLRHQGSAPSADDAFLGPEQRLLTDMLRGLDGHHPTLAASAAGPESPWTAVLLEHRRRLARQRTLLEAFARQRDMAIVRHFEDRGRRGEADAARAAEVGELEAQLATLQAQLAGAREALAHLQASTSWRVTRPLRWSTAQLEQMTRPSPPDR
jgi:hypothetical protein